MGTRLIQLPIRWVPVSSSYLSDGYPSHQLPIRWVPASSSYLSDGYQPHPATYPMGTRLIQLPIRWVPVSSSYLSDGYPSRPATYPMGTRLVPAVKGSVTCSAAGKNGGSLDSVGSSTASTACYGDSLTFICRCSYLTRDTPMCHHGLLLG
jgi:hypothetical protein